MSIKESFLRVMYLEKYASARGVFENTEELNRLLKVMNWATLYLLESSLITAPFFLPFVFFFAKFTFIHIGF